MPGPDDLPPEPPWDDDWADAEALTLAVCRDDADSQADVRAILRHGNTFGIAAVLAKLLSEIIAEQGVCHEWFRYITVHDRDKCRLRRS